MGMCSVSSVVSPTRGHTTPVVKQHLAKSRAAERSTVAVALVRSESGALYMEECLSRTFQLQN